MAFLQKLYKLQRAKRSESELIQQIVEETLTQLDRVPLDVAQYPVGIDSQAKEIKKMLDLPSKDDILMVGLLGQGGVGKTTLSKAIYNAIFRDFQGSCFLERVRENSKNPQNPNGLVHLQEQLLSQVLLGKNKARIYGVDGGIQMIRERLFNKRVLIILDDVDDADQLSALARSCEWFGKGSRIIVTTRNEHVLNSYEGDSKHVHEVKVLKDDEAMELFRKYAFPKNQEIEIPSDLINSVVHYAGGLPLGLKVLGSSLRGRGEQEWEETRQALAEGSKEEINDVLKVSYSGLKSYAAKEIFLDIACFFKGWRTEYIKKVLDSCGFQTTTEVKILIESSLISEENETLQMHDLMQSMGKDIVLGECRDDPGKRSRLWRQNDVFEVLSRQKLPKPKNRHISPKAFKKMMKLRLLILINVVNSSPEPIHLPNALMWFQWPNCSSILEFSYGPKKLVGLDMHDSKIKVPEQFEDFENLKFINYSGCLTLVYMPDLNCTPNLEELDLHGCKNLEYAHESLARHDKLRLLNLSGCSKFHDFPKKLQSKNLQLLNLNLSSKLQSFPKIPSKVEGLRGLFLIGTSIEELPASIENLISLEEMDLRYCKKLTILPSSIYRLQNLERLMLEGCSNLVEFPKKEEDPSDPHATTGFPKLYVLNLRGCNLSNVDFLKSSSFPFLRAFQQLQEIPKMPGQLRHLWAIGCESLSKFPPDTCDIEGN
ncbi:hypothetical protein BT93_H1862 [Corymbia citriodora subsp. variegata]|nr:hypothetical protein BT93_H1862 [Corymbia citriodora subsp. variegata]